MSPWETMKLVAKGGSRPLSDVEQEAYPFLGPNAVAADIEGPDLVIVDFKNTPTVLKFAQEGNTVWQPGMADWARLTCKPEVVSLV